METKWIFAAIYLLCAALLMVPSAAGAGVSVDEPPMSGELTESVGGPMEPSTGLSTEIETVRPSGDESKAPDSETDGDSGGETSAPPQDLPPSEPVTVTVYLHDQKRTVDMSIEEYVMRVVMAEMPYTFEPQALMAQAVAVRSYCFYRMEQGYDHERSGGAVCDDYRHCMALMTKEAAVERWGLDRAEEIEQAVSEAIAPTEGQVLTYDGKIIAALFHASSTGKTENAEAVWGNAYPYLVSVDSGEEPRISEMTVSLTELGYLLRVNGESDFASSLWDGGNRITLKHNESGRVAWISYGGYKMKGTDIRTALGLKSTDFSVSVSQDGTLATFTVTGSGHGLGMSQYGAQAMAELGKSYEEILAHYYSGSRICDGITPS